MNSFAMGQALFIAESVGGCDDDGVARGQKTGENCAEGEDVLLGGPRARDIKDVVIGEVYKLSDALPGLCGCFRLPFPQSSV